MNTSSVLYWSERVFFFSFKTIKKYLQHFKLTNTGLLNSFSSIHLNSGELTQPIILFNPPGATGYEQVVCAQKTHITQENQTVVAGISQ